MDAGRLANRRFAAAMEIRMVSVDTEYEPQTHGTPITLVTTLSREQRATESNKHAAFTRTVTLAEVHAAGETDAETRENVCV